MDRPDAADVRAWTTDNAGQPTFDFARYGYGVVVPPAPDRLDDVVENAVGYVERVTGRSINGAALRVASDPAAVPEASLEGLAREAVVMRVQQALVARGTTKAVRDAVQGAGVSSLRAGDYQQTNRAGDDPKKGGLVNEWRALSEVLLMLATVERRAELLAELSGQSPPAAITVETVACGDPYGYW